MKHFPKNDRNGVLKCGLPCAANSLTLASLNFPLQDLEQHLDDPYLVAGERLLHAEQVRNFTEVERHLWTAVIAGKEVELQISPSRVRAVSCDCAEFREAGMCAHVAAGLLTLRRKKQQEALVREAKQRSKKAPTKLTTKAILDQVAPEELEQFVRDYARGNREFNLMLRARFAKDVPLRDGLDAYAQMLDAALIGARRRDGSIRYKGVLKLVRLLKELLFQAETHFVRRDYGELHRLLSNVLRKIGPVISRAGKNEERLAEYLVKASDYYDRLSKYKLPADLSRRLFDFALDFLQSSTVRRIGAAARWLTILERLQTDPNRRAASLERLDTYLNQHRELRVRLLGMKMDLLHQLGRNEEARRIAEQYRHEPDLIARAAEVDVESGKAERALDLLAESFRQTPERLNLPLQRAQTRAFRALGRQEEALAQARVVFERTLSFDQPDDYALLREGIAEDRWQAFLATLTNALRTRGKTEVLKKIYARERDTAALIELLRASEHPQQLEPYGNLLFEYDPAGAKRLYTEVVERYRKSYFGEHARAELDRLTQYLYRIGQDRMAERFKTA